MAIRENHIHRGESRMYCDAYEKYGSMQAAANELGIPKTTFYRRYHEELSTGYTRPVKQHLAPPQAHEVTGTHTIQSDEALSLKDIENSLNVDRNKHSIHRVTSRQLASGKISNSVTLMPVKKEPVEIFLEALKEIKPQEPTGRTYEKHNDGVMVEFAAVDLHLGKLAHRSETGENYDIEIATRRFKDAVDQTIERVKDLNVDKFLHILGSDFFQYDNIEGTTTAGTGQDFDTRLHKLFQRGIEITKYAIDRFSEIAPVEVVLIQGNHDFTSSYYLAKVVEAFYANDENVNVNASPMPRKYVKYKKVLLGLAHGDKEKISNWALLMASEVPQAWASTVKKEVHLGHYHKRKNMSFVSTDEEMSLTVRHLPSLSGTDAWHFNKAYVGCVKAADVYIWQEDGLYCVHELRCK